MIRITERTRVRPFDRLRVNSREQNSSNADGLKNKKLRAKERKKKKS